MGTAKQRAAPDQERTITVILVCSGQDDRSKSQRDKGYRYLTDTGRKEAGEAGAAIRDRIAGQPVRVVKVRHMPSSHHETANAVARVLGVKARWDELCYTPSATDIQYLEDFGVPFIVAVVAGSYPPSGYGQVTAITYTYRWGTGSWKPQHVATTVEIL